MRAISVLVVVASALVAREAAAEDLHLSWSAPEGCPSEHQVREAALRAASTETPRDALDAQALVDRGERWTVTIRMKRAGLVAAERHLEATSCGALADATSVILAMALVPPRRDDAQGAEPPLPDAIPASPARPGLAAAEAEAERTVSSVPARGPPARGFAASASLATDGTTLPSPAVGGRAGLAWTPSRARVEIAGAYFSDQSKTTGTSEAGARLTLVAAGARGCWAVAQGDVELSPCAGADVQVVQARGYGAASNYDASAAWIAAAGGALVRVPVTGWLALRGDVDAIGPLSRPRFVVEGEGAVHRPASFGVRAGIGAELLFL
jgi:hypothetical protein